MNLHSKETSLPKVLQRNDIHPTGPQQVGKERRTPGRRACAIAERREKSLAEQYNKRTLQLDFGRTESRRQVPY